MRNIFRLLFLLCFLLFTSCRPATTTIPAVESGLGSLKKVGEYPLYTMRLAGEEIKAEYRGQSGLYSAWGCSLFAALGDPQNRLYGRNFDWEYSPALLLFSEPSDGYASVSMVDIAFLGFSKDQFQKLDELPLTEREPLLYALHLPIDGMNAKGLAVGMAAVPPGNMVSDPQKETVGSLDVIREMLDHAATVEEAVKILGSHNVDMEGGPPVHYLVADASGQAALVEFYQGEMVVRRNDSPWHLATNFLVVSTGGDPGGQCWRYDAIEKQLSESGGILSQPQALELLDRVHQQNTQWSVVYHLTDGEVQVALGHAYQDVYRFSLK